MTVQTTINFDGLSPEAAEKLAKGFVDATRAKIDALSRNASSVANMSLEDIQKADRLFGVSNAGNGGCVIGCM